MNKNTSWGKVAQWYDDMLNDSNDSFQKNVILPNLIRIINPKKDLKILDLACGQGYFSIAFRERDANVIGLDISKELIDLANKNANSLNIKDGLEFDISSADKIIKIKDQTIDTISIILALQNIENLAGTISECSRVLKTNGKLILVLNHPAFRIPQNSSWQWDENNNKQYRRIDSYMSDRSISIDMNPSETNQYKKKLTISFHRPLQSYFKALNKFGLVVERLEEWISHKKSQTGSHASEEDRMRKEIPMFICLECRKSPVATQ